MDSVQTAGLINSKQQTIDQTTSNVDKTIRSIRNSLIIDKTNDGLNGLTTKSTSLLGKDGLLNPKANYFDIYYDTEGKPYFLFNQFNPLFGWFKSRDNSNASANACSYCSYANAFILGAGVHSVVDSFGIYLFTLSYGSKTNGVIGQDSWQKLSTGDTKDWEKYSNFNIIKKYIFDKNGKPNFKATTSGKVDEAVAKAISRGDAEARFSFKMNMGNDSADIQKVIAAAEAKGYKVRVDVGGLCGGKSGNVFGSLSDSGHYVGAAYESGKGYSVIDSFGSRSSKADRAAGTVLMWSRKGQELQYHEKGVNGGNNSQLDSTGKRANTFWHDNSVMTGTDFTKLPDFTKGTGLSGTGVAYLTITKE